MSAPQSECTRPRLSGDRRGAVYVELIIAFLPVFLFFSYLVQFGLLCAASIVTKHAAWMAARAAMVIIPDNPIYYGGGVGLAWPTASPLGGLACGQPPQAITFTPNGAQLSEIQVAASRILQPMGGVSNNSLPTVTLDKGSYAITDNITVQVEYAFPCTIPVGNLMCLGPTKTITAQASIPMQGANYHYP
jgi:hypothetical protein